MLLIDLIKIQNYLIKEYVLRKIGKKLNSDEITESQVLFWNEEKKLVTCCKRKITRQLIKMRKSEFYRVDVEKLRTVYLKDLVKQKI